MPNSPHRPSSADAPCPPVLLTVFNRPGSTQKVMDALRAVKPGKLYVAADGPRDRPGERELCEETRRAAAAVDWPCEVATLFRDENVGCSLGMSGAIDWFFANEEQGIILEDDCVPSPSFFPYCAGLLDRYKDDERVMCVSGSNLLPEGYPVPDSYFFSRYMLCWGWASWRRAWALFDRDLALWPRFRDSGGLRACSDGRTEFEEYWRGIFDRAAAGEFDSWDYRWQFSCWAHGGNTCIPAVNLVSNIGFGAGGTHTAQADHRLAALPAGELSFPLRHPALAIKNSAADMAISRHGYSIRKRTALGKLRKKASRKIRGAIRSAASSLFASLKPAKDPLG